MPGTVVSIIVDGPLTPEALAEALLPHRADLERVHATGNVGATLRFDGIVRRMERDTKMSGEERALSHLEYQTYDPMAERELRSLAASVCDRFGLLSIIALHSRGLVAVGEVSFVLEVASAHRAEAIEAMPAFIDRLKQDVPIWKRAVWDDSPPATRVKR
ncbi:MAG: molybdenum cofactor biosynthesis protein MoaE [Phycisphaerales bacterium]|nr:molybdenum cofactor biosynthesis protein MoaE [Phycisphaerales bacterium]